MDGISLPDPRSAATTRTTLTALQRALDLDSLWQATRDLVDNMLQLHSCSLMFGIADYEPRSARHHVVEAPRPDYEPATSLTVSQPYLHSHPRIELYTYSQIVTEDPAAASRRLAQESITGSWAEFVHLAFWHGSRLEAVFSVRRALDHPRFSREEISFLQHIYPMIDAGLHRVRTLESERTRRSQLEHLLYTSALPIMLVDAEGVLLFATATARRCYQRWIDAIAAPDKQRGGDHVGLPPEFLVLLERARMRAALRSDRLSPSELPDSCAHHPSIPDLAIRADVCQQRPDTLESSTYILTFSTAPEGAASRELSSSALAALQRLSPSERRVALLVAEGLRNQDISNRLSRSLRTIEFQLNSVYRKLDVTSRTQLLRLLA